MASSPERWLVSGAIAVAVSVGCSQGQGEGALTGTLTVADCGLSAAPFDLQPTFFSGEIVDQLLAIRVQSGSDLEVYSDGLHLLVHDVADVRAMLGVPLAIGGEGAPVSATLFLNNTCPPGRRDVPRVLVATGGSITFDAIYAPAIDEGERAIRVLAPDSLQLSFAPDPAADPDLPERSGNLSGWFSFFYQRGRPSQRYP